MKAPQWTLLYYPDVSQASWGQASVTHIYGYYDSLAHCQAKARGMQRLSRAQVAVYQCGYQCERTKNTLLMCQHLSQ